MHDEIGTIYLRGIERGQPDVGFGNHGARSMPQILGISKLSAPSFHFELSNATMLSAIFVASALLLRVGLSFAAPSDEVVASALAIGLAPVKSSPIYAKFVDSPLLTFSSAMPLSALV